MTRFLTAAEAAGVYDRIGRWQDRQGWYERPAVDALLSHVDLTGVRRVVEVGCGTGALAARLLADHLAPEARYLGIDVSPVMTRLARERLTAYAGRATVVRAAHLPVRTASTDLVLATYVLDLLAPPVLRELLDDMARVLRPGGRLAVAGLTEGRGLARWVSDLWRAVAALQPALVGGCRPIDLRPVLGPSFSVDVDGRVRAVGITSQVLVARRTPRRNSGGRS